VLYGNGKKVSHFLPIFAPLEECKDSCSVITSKRKRGFLDGGCQRLPEIIQPPEIRQRGYTRLRIGSDALERVTGGGTVPFSNVNDKGSLLRGTVLPSVPRMFHVGHVRILEGIVKDLLGELIFGGHFDKHGMDTGVFDGGHFRHTSKVK